MLNIITVEGPSNTGKSTLLDMLEKTFKGKGADVYRLSVSRLDDGLVDLLKSKVSKDDMQSVLDLKLAKEATVKLIDEYRKTRAHSLLIEIVRLKHAQLRAVMASFETLERDSGLGNTYLLIDRTPLSTVIYGGLADTYLNFQKSLFNSGVATHGVIRTLSTVSTYVNSFLTMTSPFIKDIRHEVIFLTSSQPYTVGATYSSESDEAFDKESNSQHELFCHRYLDIAGASSVNLDKLNMAHDFYHLRNDSDPEITLHHALRIASGEKIEKTTRTNYLVKRI
nr:MAG TPA: Zeta toxin [Caudoviricetes sp.]